MLSQSSIAFVKRLLDAPGPSGYETLAAQTWREEAQTFADAVRSDVAGNSYAEVNPGGSPTILLDGHIDEIGLIARYIDDDGFVYVGPIGGWDPEVLVGQRLRFLTGQGNVVGVVGKKPIHLMKSADRDKAVKLTELWVDIGASNRADAEARLSVGDAAVVDTHVVDLPNDRIASRAIDDRIGAFVVLEALRRYKERPGKARVVAVATTQEEIGWHGGGALIAANAVNPQMAIAVDVTFATDHPDVEKKELGDHRLGSGPVLARGSLISPVIFDLLRSTAAAHKISYTVNAEGSGTSTNADAIHLAREGVATALVSIPNRYMHSPNEMVSLVDVHHAASLIEEACRGVDDRTDFTAR